MSTSPEIYRRISYIQLPTDWVEKDPNEDGFCYLSLFDERAVQHAAFVLGPYPKWGDVKSFGCFARGRFHVVRKDNLVHICSHGAGIAAKHLPISDGEVVGAARWLMPLWHVALWMLAISVFSWPGMLMFIFVNYHYIVEVFSRLNLPVSTKVSWNCSFKEIVLTVLIFQVTLASAKLTMSVESILESHPGFYTREELRLLWMNHVEMLDGYDASDRENLCFPDRLDLVKSLLDLDVNPSVVDTYFTTLCPVSDWREKLKGMDPPPIVDDYNGGDFDDDYLEALGAISGDAIEEFDNVLEMLSETANQVATIVENNMDFTVDTTLKMAKEIAEESVRVAVHTAQAVANATDATVGTGLKLLNEVSEGEKEIFDVIKEVGNAIPKPSEVVKQVINNTPELNSMVSTIENKVSAIAADAEGGVSNLYYNLTNATSDLYNTVTKPHNWYKAIGLGLKGLSNLTSMSGWIVNRTAYKMEEEAPNIGRVIGETTTAVISGFKEGLDADNEESPFSRFAKYWSPDIKRIKARNSELEKLEKIKVGNKVQAERHKRKVNKSKRKLANLTDNVVIVMLIVVGGFTVLDMNTRSF